MKRLILALLALCALLLAGCGQTATVSPAQKTATAQQGAQGVSGLPTVALSQLPREAQKTYDLVVAGGPFPYSQDGQTFGNREGNLPKEDYGWYREFTIPTPGSRDRGAQRFVVGEDDVFFYTDDHYNSFSEVIA